MVTHASNPSTLETDRQVSASLRHTLYQLLKANLLFACDKTNLNVNGDLILLIFGNKSTFNPAQTNVGLLNLICSSRFGRNLFVCLFLLEALTSKRRENRSIPFS